MSLAVPFARIKVYHASTTGANGEILNSFLREGARSDLAQGYGQGMGFYVWTDLDLAKAHIEYLRSNIQDYEYPLIVTIDANLNPQEWDLDYENNMEIILGFIWGHWDLFKKIPDNVLKSYNGFGIMVSQCEKMGMFNKFIRFRLARPDGSIVQEDVNIKRKYNDQSTEAGSIIGQIFNYMQKYHPSETNKFESTVFLNYLNKKHIAIKYVGKRSIPISSFQIQVDKKWIAGEQALKLVQSRKAA